MLNAIPMLSRRHLLERPLRTLITIVGIGLGVSVSIAIGTANVEALRSFEESIIAVAGRATLQVSGGELGLDEHLIQAVRRHPHVLSVTPVVYVGSRVATGPHQGKPLIIMGLDLLELVELKGVRVKGADGHDPAFENLLSSQAIFIGKRLASEWGVAVGTPLDIAMSLHTRRVVVEGIVESEGGRPSAWDNMGVMDIASAQALFGLVGRLDRIDLVTEPGRSVEEIAEELTRLLPPTVTVSRPSRRNEQIERMVRAFQLNLEVLSAVGLLVGLLLVYNTVSFAAVQRRREIGMLSALGMTRRAVTALFLGEAAIMGIIGGILGSWFGVLLARSLVSLLSRTISDLYVPVEPTPGVVESRIEFVHVPLFWLQGGMLGAIVSMLGALGPSVEAGRTAPARALPAGDYESTRLVQVRPMAWAGLGLLALSGLLTLPGPVQGLPLFGYASALCLLLGISCLAPALVHGFGRFLHRASGVVQQTFARKRGVGELACLAADQVARAPGRNAITISSMMVGIAVMVGVGTMIGSFRHTVQIWIDQTILADLIVAPTSWLQGDDSGMLAKRIPLAWAQRVASIPGVAAVDTYRELTVELDGRPVALVSRDLRLHAQRSRYLFISGDSTTTLERTVAEDGVIISEVLARTAGLNAGEALRLMTPAGEREFSIHGIFYDYATDGGKVVMDRALYRRIWNDDTTTVLAVYLMPGADGTSIRRRIADRFAETGRENQPAVISNGELKREILVIFDRTFRITYALEFIAVVIAVLGIINTLLTAILERRRELATLRSIGASATQIQALMLWESGYLGLLGGLLGVFGGFFLAVLLIQVINKQSFGWTIQFAFQPWLLFQALALASTAALLAGYLPARWAAKQPIAEGLRYE
ncbi:MAG: hypothetical protein C4293_02275 [Nitrospiraceae bacterium]